MIRYIWLVCVGIVAIACTAVPEDAATVAPTRVMGVVTATAVPPTPTATNTPETVSSPTPVPMCTPPACTENEVYFCPGECPNGCGTVCATPTPDNLGPAPTTWAELETWLAQAWREGLPPETVTSRLYEAGWMREDDRSTDYPYWTVVDLNGDGETEWIFSLHGLPDQFDYSPLAPVGNLWIIGKNGVLYRYYNEVPSNPHWEFPLPKVANIADMVGDGLPVLIIDARTFDFHASYAQVSLLHVVDGVVQNLVSSTEEEPYIDMSIPDMYLKDYQGDGLPDLYIHGGYLGTLAWGELRTYTEIWSWDGTAVTLADTILDPTEYRHHILYEANDEFVEGNLDRARVLYEQAVVDPTLLIPYAHPTTFEEGATEEETKDQIYQFAAFRLLLIALLQENRDLAQSRLDWLNQQYPDTPITTAAHTLVNNWNGRDSLNSLCTEIAAELNADENPVPPFLNLGLGNPKLTPGDVCPTEQEE